MLDFLWQADTGLVLGALGFVTGIASLLYARSQARGAHAQVEGARKQAEEALRAAELVAESARQQAVEALRAAGLVAESARQQAVEALKAAGLVAESAKGQATEALRAAGLVAEGAREQATQALLAANLLADSAVSARVRDMRARNFRSNPNLPAGIRAIITAVGGPDAYAVILDAMDVAQEVHALRARGLVSDENWRRWMNDQMVLISSSPHFHEVFRREAGQGVLLDDFVAAMQPVFAGKGMVDPAPVHRVTPAGATGPGQPTLAPPLVPVHLHATV